MDERIQSRLNDIRSLIKKDIKNSEEAFEKLLVAITGVFRLLDGKQSMLAALQGSSADVQGYVLKLLGQVTQQIYGSYEGLITEFDNLVNQIEKL